MVLATVLEYTASTRPLRMLRCSIVMLIASCTEGNNEAAALLQSTGCRCRSHGPFKEGMGPKPKSAALARQARKQAGSRAGRQVGSTGRLMVARPSDQ